MSTNVVEVPTVMEQTHVVEIPEISTVEKAGMLPITEFLPNTRAHAKVQSLKQIREGQNGGNASGASNSPNPNPAGFVALAGKILRRSM
eukprot:4576094-Amphidinium_carterae.1